MKNFWALPAFLRLAIATQQAFNVNDDLFAFPQYEIIYNDESPVTSEYAAEKLGHGQTTLTPGSDLSKPRPSDPPDIVHDTPLVLKWEKLTYHGSPYLCSIPTIPPPPPSVASNRTAEDEANDLALAVHRGQELLKGMEGNCIYFVSGWWSYSFCYNEGVRQFHPLPSGRNVPIYPPVEDKSVGAYILGRFQGTEREEDDDNTPDDIEEPSKNHKSTPKKEQETGLAKLEVKGQKGAMRYLVHNLKGGTVCDLTGEERSIEVQFQCENIPTDRISIIKETSICQYRMVISTPRLCNDVAFQPPKGPKPHPISCSPVMEADKIQPYIDELQAATADYEAEYQRTAKEYVNEAMEDIKAILGVGSKDADVDGNELVDGEYDIEIPKTKNKVPSIMVGDIEIGGHNLVPKSLKLPKRIPMGAAGSEKVLGTIAKSDGFTASEKDLAKLNIQGGKELEVIKDKVRRTAAGADWQIDVVETGRGVRELRGIIGDAKVPAKEPAAEGKEDKEAPKKKEAEDFTDTKDKKDDEEETGSEETYKEEL
ncbi:hypothetical protein BT63DRAFT_420290 [Microthyrium microscopicum]|uniref:Endoplasmic reticulum lectin n=1 Tax=Microthyrium microscopicum TaxID=703497 RepID=A0A6A6UTG0_9PEZI|nr:hypothetical protein BT63DRAFT_420290 [Microthyrium microscopicum]